MAYQYNFEGICVFLILLDRLLATAGRHSLVLGFFERGHAQLLGYAHVFDQQYIEVAFGLFLNANRSTAYSL